MTIERRDFITLLGGAAAWPISARAQQRLPVVGGLHAGTREQLASLLPALRKGLSEAGFVEGQSVMTEHRYAEGHYDRLPELAADLVRRRVAVIYATGGGGVGPLAAKAATTTIPIVFTTGSDPVQSGIVSSLNRPGGNITGVSFVSNVSESKRLGLLRTVVPQATTIGVLTNPDNASVATGLRDLTEAASALGVKLQIANARNDPDLEPAFASFVQHGAGGLVIAADAFFNSRVKQLAALAARYATPAIYSPAGEVRDAAAAGGLMSYGASLSEAFHQAGLYIGRILHGEKPGDLPVMLPTKFELVINLKTAKALGLTLPPTLLAIADEVIE
jgi:putative ABC transport system substrate-binding protein